MRSILPHTPTKRLNDCASYCLCLCLGLLLHSVTNAQPPEIEAQSSTASASAQSSAASSEAPLYESRALRDKSLIAKAAGEQAQWLDTEYGKLLVFYRPTEAKRTRGVLVLFHAAEDPQRWPPILENLRANLPRYGWETLAVTLPGQYPASVPQRPSSSSISSTAATVPPNAEVPSAEATSASSVTTSEPSTQSSSTASSIVPRDTLIQAYVAATFEFLKNKGQFNAVLLVDNSSANPVLTQLLSQIKENTRDPATIDGPIQALVITNLQSQEPLTTSELAAIFSNKQLPVLDVFFNPDDLEQIKARDLHKAIAMRLKLNSYLQASLDNQPKIVETDPRSFLAARVRGFMQRHASGTEVKGSGEANDNTVSP